MMNSTTTTSNQLPAHINDRIKEFYEAYQLHEDYGFYHHLFEDEELPIEFKPLEELALQTSKLNIAMETGKAVEALQMSYHDDLIKDLSYNQAMKLYTLVTFLTNSYLFYDPDQAKSTLPKPLSTILCSVAKKLENRPIMTFSCCAFWNTQVIDPKASVNLDNLKLRITFTGNAGEEWFYLVSIANDIVGMRAMKNLIAAEGYIAEHDEEGVIEQLTQVLDHFEIMIKSIKRMHERLDAEWFYSELRRFLTGYQKMPNGLIFEGIPEYSKEGPKFPGMSAGQSPFYQTFQNALGFKHSDERITSMEAEIFEGMTGVNKRMITEAKDLFSIREYAKAKGGAVQEAYNNIVDAYIKSKQAHWMLIAKFIMVPAKKQNVDTRLLTGVGGTPLSALKQMSNLLAMNKLD